MGLCIRLRRRVLGRRRRRRRGRNKKGDGIY
jgi:hypothetical protein